MKLHHLIIERMDAETRKEYERLRKDLSHALQARREAASKGMSSEDLYYCHTLYIEDIEDMILELN